MRPAAGIAVVQRIATGLLCLRDGQPFPITGMGVGPAAGQRHRHQCAVTESLLMPVLRQALPQRARLADVGLGRSVPLVLAEQEVHADLLRSETSRVGKKWSSAFQT